jgi:hypothetical protein
MAVPSHLPSISGWDEATTERCLFALSRFDMLSDASTSLLLWFIYCLLKLFSSM